MRVYYDAEGNFLRATGSSIFKQSNDTNELILVLPYATGDDVASVSTTFLLPYGKNSGQYGQYAPISMIMSLIDDPTDGLVWYNKIGDGYLVNKGTAKLSARVVYKDKTIKTSEQVRFEVEPSGDYIATAIPDDTATQLDEKINDLERKKQDKVDKRIGVIEGEPDNILGTNEVVRAINTLAKTLYLDYSSDDTVKKSLVQQVIENLNKLVQHDTEIGQHDTAIDKNKEDIGKLNIITADHETRITDNSRRIGINEVDIKKLQDDAYTGVNKVSTITSSKAPFPIPVDELNAEVLRVEGRKPKNGDYIVWKDTTNMKTYEIWFGGGVDGHWQEPDEVEPINQATNRIYGIVRGNAEDPERTAVKTNIINGIIQDIQVLTQKGDYKGIATYLNSLNTTVENILSGVTSVGRATNADKANTATNADYATKAGSATEADRATSANTAGSATTADTADMAIGDIDGNPIDTTYAKIENVYDKDQADNKFLPIGYGYVYYFSRPENYPDNKYGIVDVIPTDVTPQFEVTVSSIGTTTVFDLERVLDKKYVFNKNTTDNSQIWISTDRPCTLKFRLVTQGKKGAEIIPLAVDTTGELLFQANSPKAVNILSIYSQLTDEEVFVSGNIHGKKLEVVTDFSTPTKISMWCNETYPSTFNLVAKSITFNVNKITGKKKYDLYAKDWELHNGKYTATITQRQHGLAPSNQYGIDVMYASAGGWQRAVVSPLITDSGNITLTSATPLDCQVLIWLAVDIDDIGKNGTLVYLDDTLITEMTTMVTLGSHKDGTKFNIKPEVVAKMFGDISPKVNMEWSQYSLDLYRFDREAGGDKIYFTNVLIYNKVRYTYTLEVNRTDNSGILYMTEEPIIPQPAEQDKGKVLGVNDKGEYEYTGKTELTLKVDTVPQVTDMDTLRTALYDLRKSSIRSYQLQGDEAKRVLGILGYPSGLNESTDIFLYFDIPYSEAGGFEIDIKVMGRNSNPLYTRTMHCTINSNWQDTGWTDISKPIATKEEVNSLSMCPSDNIIKNIYELPIEAGKVQTYIAPSNGYIVFATDILTDKEIINLYISGKMTTSVLKDNDNKYRGIMPVKKDDEISLISRNTIKNYDLANFIYSEDIK